MHLHRMRIGSVPHSTPLAPARNASTTSSRCAAFSMKIVRTEGNAACSSLSAWNPSSGPSLKFSFTTATSIVNVLKHFRISEQLVAQATTSKRKRDLISAVFSSWQSRDVSSAIRILVRAEVGPVDASPRLGRGSDTIVSSPCRGPVKLRLKPWGRSNGVSQRRQKKCPPNVPGGSYLVKK